MSSLWAGSDLVGWDLHSSWAFSLFFLLFSFLFPFILLIILLIFCFYVGVWRRLASPRRPEEVGRHTSPQRLKNIDNNVRFSVFIIINNSIFLGAVSGLLYLLLTIMPARSLSSPSMICSV